MKFCPLNIVWSKAQSCKFYKEDIKWIAWSFLCFLNHVTCPVFMIACLSGIAALCVLLVFLLLTSISTIMFWYCGKYELCRMMYTRMFTRMFICLFLSMATDMLKCMLFQMFRKNIYLKKHKLVISFLVENLSVSNISMIPLLQVGEMARGSPRPYSKSKGSHGLNLGRDWGLGLGQATWDIRDFQNSNMDTTVQHILR